MYWKKYVTFLLLTYYVFGTLVLPLGDFSVIDNLPNMYKNCLANEHSDMTVLDFFTDHLINIDGVFDQHQKGDQQKPHTSFKYNNIHTQIINFENHYTQVINYNSKSIDSFSLYSKDFYTFHYSSFLFRPPIF